MTDNIADLARRLIELCIDWTGEPIVDGSTPRIEPDCGLLREAAQALTRIAGERDEAHEHMVPISVDGKSVFIDGHGDVDLDFHDARLARAQAAEVERDRLKVALKPFAAADRALGDDPGPYRLQTDTGYREIPRSDLRRAREALGETK